VSTSTTTNITGMLKGNGSNVAGAVPGVDYMAPSGLANIPSGCVLNAPVTGTTANQVLFSCPIPAGMIGAHGVVRVFITAAVIGAASSEWVDAILAASATATTGPVLGFTFPTTNTAATFIGSCTNQSSQSSQICQGVGGATASNSSTGTINTAAASYLNVYFPLNHSGDQITVNQVQVEVIPIS
jgi:hypothetical protein